MTGYQGNTSSIDFGNQVTAKMKNETNIFNASLPINNDFFWSINVQAFAVGNNSNATNSSFAFKQSYYSFFDSGTSHIIVPPSVFSGLIKQLLIANGNPEFQLYQGVPLIACNTTQHVSMFWMFNNYWIEILPEEYIIDVSRNGDGSVCMFMIIQLEYEFFIFGQPAHQNYYTTHKMGNNASITFIPG